MATLLHRWKLDEGTGQYAYSSVSDNPLTVYDDTENDRGVTWTAAGYNGAGLQGDTSTGAETGAVSEGSLSRIPTDLTVMCWFKIPSPYSRNIVTLQKAAGSPQLDYGCAIQMHSIDGIGRLVFGSAVGGGFSGFNNVLISAAYDCADDDWHHAAGCIDSSAGIIRVVLDCSASTQVSRVPNATSGTFHWHIGGGAYGLVTDDGAWPGIVDDIRIYDGPMTDAEICAAMDDFEPPAVTNAIMFSCNT